MTLKYAVCGVLLFYFFSPAWHSHPWNRLGLNATLAEKLLFVKACDWGGKQANKWEFCITVLNCLVLYIYDKGNIRKL